jgi:hypothetical protein
MRPVRWLRRAARGAGCRRSEFTIEWYREYLSPYTDDKLFWE